MKMHEIIVGMKMENDMTAKKLRPIGIKKSSRDGDSCKLLLLMDFFIDFFTLTSILPFYDSIIKVLHPCNRGGLKI